MDQSIRLNKLNKMYKDDKKQKLFGEKPSIGASKSTQNILDLKPQGIKSQEDMGQGFVGLAAHNDYVKDVGINRVFAFENQKRAQHQSLVLQNKE